MMDDGQQEVPVQHAIGAKVRYRSRWNPAREGLWRFGTVTGVEQSRGHTNHNSRDDCTGKMVYVFDHRRASAGPNYCEAEYEIISAEPDPVRWDQDEMHTLVDFQLLVDDFDLVDPNEAGRLRQIRVSFPEGPAYDEAIDNRPTHFSDHVYVEIHSGGQSAKVEIHRLLEWVAEVTRR